MSSLSRRPDSEIASSPPVSEPVRPRFNHQNTNDRLRESSGRPLSFSMISNIRKDRRSMFKELGLDTEGATTYTNHLTDKGFSELTGLSLHSASTDRTDRTDRTSEHNSERNSERGQADGGRHTEEAQSPRDRDDPSQNVSPRSQTSTNSKAWYSKLVTGRRPKVKAAASAPPPTMSSITRLTSTALLIAVVLPCFSYYNGREKVSLNGADAGVINRGTAARYGPVLDSRADSPAQVCKRWSHQSASLNGTLYIYGGQAITSRDQQTNTWNNNFLTLDLTKSWDASSPSLSGLAQPSGPPAVANGYLWNDYNNLYLYGGEFATNTNPYTSPAPISTWQYSIGSRTWIEHPNPKTSAGNASAPNGVPVQRAAEGAGFSLPELGVSWYFGGHLDWATTPGWSTWTPRVYLKTLLEFTHPGYTNDGVASLSQSGAGDGGVYRNITEGGLQVQDAFSERADGALVYVPGWGEKGVLIGFAGGNADTFVSDLSALDVYDIASSQWYHQQTSGTPPGVRVNPCAVIASAPDASSFQIYLFGGQNLIPAGSQTQYSDMYILSIPSFTWFQVPQGGSPKPSGRSGHSCNLRDGQMVLVGGYTGNGTDCDSPGIYIFNASSLEWTSRFTALDHAPDLNPENSVLGSSFGYKVPDIVASVIGGDGEGHATVTTPAVGPATRGPFATGKPPVFTITASGSTATITQAAPGATGSAGGGSSTTTSGDDRRPALIAAGVIAGLAGLLAIYLGYCAWLYRRQVRAYKTHLAVANRYSANSASRGSFRGLAAFFGRRESKKLLPREEAPVAEKQKKQSTSVSPNQARLMRNSGSRRGRAHRRDESTSTADSFAWVPGQQVEPKLLFDDPTPDSGYVSSPGAGKSPGYAGPYGARLQRGGANAGGVTPSSSEPTPGSGKMPQRSGSGASGHSTDGLLDGQEPSFFSVVMGPRRALRVVNGLEGEGEGQGGNGEAN